MRGMSFCRCCRHPQRDTIEAQLLASVGYRKTSQNTGISLAGICRQARHLKGSPGLALKPRTETDLAKDSEANLRMARKLLRESLRNMELARQRNGLRASNGAAANAIRLVELRMRAAGQLAPVPSQSLHLHVDRTDALADLEPPPCGPAVGVPVKVLPGSLLARGPILNAMFRPPRPLGPPPNRGTPASERPADAQAAREEATLGRTGTQKEQNGSSGRAETER